MTDKDLKQLEEELKDLLVKALAKRLEEVIHDYLNA